MQKVKFLVSGIPYGYAYGAGEEGEVSEDALAELLEKRVVELAGAAEPAPPPAGTKNK